MSRGASIKTSTTASPQTDRHSTESVAPIDSTHDSDFTRILQEDKIKVMRTRTIALFNENVYLKSQLLQESTRAKELEERLADAESRLRLRCNSSKESEDFNVPENQFNNANVTTVCRLCYKALQKTDMENPIIFITKAELNNLESDMVELRDALSVREKAWAEMMEREQSYYLQLTRLAQEIITANQLVENRGNDLKTMAAILEEREGELKTAQKDTAALKKLVAKLERRNRALEENRGENTETEMNERDLKWIQSIVRQVTTPRNQQTSKGGHYSTPRNSKNSAREITNDV